MGTASRSNLLARWEPIQTEEDGWRQNRLFVTNLVTGELLWERTIDSTSPLRLAWSRDGRYLFFNVSEWDSPIWRLTADGGDLTEIVPDGYLLGVRHHWEATVPPLTVSPDGRWRVTAQISTPVTVDEEEMEQSTAAPLSSTAATCAGCRRGHYHSYANLDYSREGLPQANKCFFV